MPLGMLQEKVMSTQASLESFCDIVYHRTGAASNSSTSQSHGDSKYNVTRQHWQ